MADIRRSFFSSSPLLLVEVLIKDSARTLGVERAHEGDDLGVGECGITGGSESARKKVHGVADARDLGVEIFEEARVGDDLGEEPRQLGLQKPQPCRSRLQESGSVDAVRHRRLPEGRALLDGLQRNQWESRVDLMIITVDHCVKIEL